MVKLRTNQQIRECLRDDDFKFQRGITGSGKYIYENANGDRVVVDWDNRTIEDVYPVDGAWHHIWHM